jgi:hypothetical protein
VLLGGCSYHTRHAINIHAIKVRLVGTADDSGAMHNGFRSANQASETFHVP